SRGLVEGVPECQEHTESKRTCPAHPCPAMDEDALAGLEMRGKPLREMPECRTVLRSTVIGNGEHLLSPRETVGLNSRRIMRGLCLDLCEGGEAHNTSDLRLRGLSADLFIGFIAPRHAMKP